MRKEPNKTVEATALRSRSLTLDVRRLTMRTAFPLFILMSLPLSAWATEPYKVDVTQQAFADSAPGIDHLEPARGDIPEFYYIAQFIESPSFIEGSYLVVLRTEDGRYLMRTGKTPKERSFAKPPKTDTEIQIPESLARVIYQIWVNALLEVRYDRKAYRGLDGAGYTFSTFVRALGWMHGGIWSPSGNSPPAWMVDAGSKLIAFAHDPKRNAKKTEAEMTTVRDKLFRYIKTHGKH